MENTCQCCDKLKSELHKAKMDITSYEEIINILLEELLSSQLKQKKKNGHLSEDEYVYPTSREDTAKVSSGIGSNRSNLIQIIPAVNKCEVLANLNDRSEAMCNTSGSVEKNMCNMSGSVEKTYLQRSLRRKARRRIKRKVKNIIT